MPLWSPLGDGLSQYKNGIVRGEGPEDLQVGDYVEQVIRKQHGNKRARTSLPWYVCPPSASKSRLDRFEGMDAGTVYGPIHAIDDTLGSMGLVSVAVPLPWKRQDLESRWQEVIPEVIWINVYTNRRGDHLYCRKVPVPVVQEWERQGWQHTWCDMVLP